MRGERGQHLGCLHFLVVAERCLVRQQLQIADVTLTIDSDGFLWDFEPDSRYRPFQVEQQAGDVHVHVHWHSLDLEDLGQPVFSARDIPGRYPPNWTLYCGDQGLWHLQVNASAYPVFRQRVAVFQPDFRRGDLYVDLAHQGLPVYPYPLGAPLDRVLFVNIVTHGLGIMLHACGIVQQGKAYIFAGPSDSGKTTLARLWADAGEAIILGDECLILRRKGGEFWVHGTPWVGESNLFSPLGAPVESIFFIRHAVHNSFSPIPTARTAENLLAQSILTPYDPIAVHHGLDFSLGLAREVPAYEFGFVPDETAVRMVQRLTGHA